MDSTLNNHNHSNQRERRLSPCSCSIFWYFENYKVLLGPSVKDEIMRSLGWKNWKNDQTLLNYQLYLVGWEFIHHPWETARGECQRRILKCWSSTVAVITAAGIRHPFHQSIQGFLHPWMLTSLFGICHRHLIHQTRMRDGKHHYLESKDSVLWCVLTHLRSLACISGQSPSSSVTLRGNMMPSCTAS